MFWSSGMTNPLTAIEQITYLIFLKRLEGLDDERVKQGKSSLFGPRANCSLPHSPDEKGQATNDKCQGHETCKWSYLSQFPDHNHLSQYVFPWLRQLDTTIEMMGNGVAESQKAAAGRLEDAYFQLPPEKANRARATIKGGKVVSVEILSSQPRGVFDTAVRTAMMQYGCQAGEDEIKAEQTFDFKTE